MKIKPIEWKQKDLYVLDQTLLPDKSTYIHCRKLVDVFDAIKVLKVRGAPLIGITAAYGILVALKEKDEKKGKNYKNIVKESGDYLKKSRPTAVNLEWAVNRMYQKAVLLDDNLTGEEFFKEMEKEADSIFREDYEMSEKIGRYGCSLIADGATVLTHCNAGGLATSGLGTALSPIYMAKEEGKEVKVYVDETRPLLQGARLTSFELTEAGIEVILIGDSMAAFVMSQGCVDLVIVGADRIVANGDTANKIGTLGLSILASHFKIPFYVAAPASTFDLQTITGKDIPIEQRDPEELKCFAGKKMAPEKVGVYNPAFDVTDHSFITAFVTDKGIITPPFEENLKKALQ